MQRMVIGLVLCQLVLGAAVSGQQMDNRGAEREQNQRRGPREDGRFGQRRWPEDPRMQREATVTAGYVFLNGEFVPPPYEIRRDGESVKLNGHVLRFHDQENGQYSMQRLAPRELADKLRLGSVVVMFDDDPVVILNDRLAIELLRAVSDTTTRPAATREVVSTLPPIIKTQEWEQWLANYEAPGDLKTAAVQRVKEVDTLRQQGDQAIAANQRLNTWAYPLTIFGMLASVVSFGHLLQFPPRGSSDSIPSRRRAELCRATVIFLAMVVVLSGLDLVWTLLTSQAGQMHELNPIGNHLLDKPWMLSAFKVTATVFSCSLLLYLRKHPRAQLASWWLCLVCTLLTFRWLVLNSMFVA